MSKRYGFVEVLWDRFPSGANSLISKAELNAFIGLTNE